MTTIKQKPINNKELYVEIVTSIGTGRLSKKAENMLYELGLRAITKMSYSNEDDKNDCLQNGLFQLFSNWYKFNKYKTNNAFAYFTEIFKRGVSAGYNELYKLRGDMDNEYKIYSINSTNDGDGMFNI